MNGQNLIQNSSLTKGNNILKDYPYEVVRNHEGEERKVSPEEARIVRMLQTIATKCSLQVIFATYSSFTRLKSTWGRFNLNPVVLNQMVKNHPYSLFSLTLKYPFDIRSGEATLPQNPLTKLPVECKSIPYLYYLRLDGLPINSLVNLPPIKRLNIKNGHFIDLIGCPATIGSVESLIFEFCRNLKSLEGLPKEMPDLLHLSIHISNLQTLNDLPHMPNLRILTCNGGNVRNFAGIPAIHKHCSWKFVNNLMISPHGMPIPRWERLFRVYFKHIKQLFQQFPNQFPASFLPKLDLTRHTWQEILAFFVPDPQILAIKYVNDENLSIFDQDRIWAEGTMSTLRFLIQRLPPTDFVLSKLAHRWGIALTPQKLENFLL